MKQTSTIQAGSHAAVPQGYISGTLNPSRTKGSLKSLLSVFLMAMMVTRAFSAVPIVPNKSRTITDIGTAAANTGSVNNLLSGVTDPDGGTSFSITSFTVNGVATAVPGSYVIPNPNPSFPGTNIGSITINANGTYTFAPAQLAASPGTMHYNSNYGPVPPITFTVSDAQNETATGNLLITVNPFNEGPANIIPSYATTEDTPLTLNTLQTNGIPKLSEIDDAAEINGVITVSLFISQDDLSFAGSMGSISATAGHGLTVTVRNDNNGLTDGKADTVGVTLTGPINEVNAYLADPTGNGIIWTPPSDYNTSTGCIPPYRLTMLSNDHGNTSNGAPGTPRTDRTTRIISIPSRVDITNDALVTTYNTAKSFNVLTGTDGATPDNFENPDRYVSRINGTEITDGQTVALPSGNSITINQNGEVVFTPAAGYSGMDSFQYSVRSGPCEETATVTIDVGPMPVKLITFRAEAEQSAVLLYWSTSEEINSAFFEVQRCSDAVTWKAVIRINAAGDSKAIINYFYQDVLPHPGTNYYRLKMVDVDSSFTYSSIKPVRTFQKQAIQPAYPNPANAFLKVPGISSGTLRLQNMNGTAFEVSVIQEWANIETLPAGIYVVSIPMTDKTFAPQRLVIAR